MKLLPPQRLRPEYYEATEQAIKSVFDSLIFDPVFNLLVIGDSFENAPTPADVRALRLAIRSGLIQYRSGVFSGDFDANTTRALRAIGAGFDFRSEVFRLAQDKVPAWIKGEASAAELTARDLNKRLERLLGQTKARIEGGQLPFAFDEAATVAMESIEDGFKTAADAIGIARTISPAARAVIEKRYAEDVRPYVVADTARYIDDLHEIVAESAATGYRHDHLIDDIQRLYGVSQRKARFLARQETALFMANYRRERFTAAGLRRYKWSTSHDIRVRPYDDDTAQKKYGDHRVLDGQFFYYDTKAPAHLMSCKKPCNPGEDFKCRCVDLAIVE